MSKQEVEKQKSQRSFGERLERATTLEEIKKLFTEIFSARDEVGRGYALSYANSLCEAAASATRTRPDLVSDIVDHMVLPFIELERDINDETPRFLIDQDYLRKNIDAWICQYPHEEMVLVRDSVLSVLEKRLKANPSKSYFWCVSTIGFRNDSIEELLWKLADDNGKNASIAARTLIATGLSESQRGVILDLVAPRTGESSFAELAQLAIQELVGPGRMQIAVDFLQKSIDQKEGKSSLSDGLAVSVVTRAVDRCDDDAAIHDEIWSLVNQMDREVSQSGEYGYRCNSANVVRDYFTRLADELNIENGKRGHLDYIYLSRLQELVKPAHLRGWRTFISSDLTNALVAIASNDSKHFGRVATTASRIKPLAMITLLEIGFETDTAFIEKAVAGETSGFVSEAICKLLACTRVVELPGSVLDLVSKSSANDNEAVSVDKDDTEYFCQQLGLIELARSCRSRDAFEAMLNFAFTYKGEVLLATIDAISELAIARIEEGDKDIGERLLTTIRDGRNVGQRKAAATVFSRLCWSRYLRGKQLRDLIRLVQDEAIDAYTRSEILEAIARTDFSISYEAKLHIWSMTTSKDETLRWRAIEVFVMRDWLDEQSEGAVLKWLDLLSFGDRIEVADPKSLVGWQAYLLGVFYSKAPKRFSNAVADVFENARADVFYQLIRSVKRLGDANPPNVIAAFAARIRKLNTAYSTDTDVFSVLAELSPKQLLILIDSNQWQDWRVEGRASLCEAAELAMKRLQTGDPLASLLMFIKDSAFQVRRSAYRVLANLDHPELFSLCQLWADSNDVEWERRAAELTQWFPADLYSDEMIRSMCFQGHREPVVRRAFDGVLLRRRQRVWAKDYTAKLLAICRCEAFDAAEAFRLSRAIAKVGDDETIEQISEMICSSSLSIWARNLLKRTEKELEKQWKQTTSKWPDPWSHETGDIEKIDGDFILEDGTKIHGFVTLWRKHRFNQSEKYSWGGFATELSGRLGFRADQKNLKLEIADRPTSDVLIVNAHSRSWKGTEIRFHGQSEYPHRSAPPTDVPSSFEQVLNLFQELEVVFSKEQADQVAKRVLPIVEASDLAKMLKSGSKQSSSGPLLQEVALILRAIGMEIRAMPKYEILLWQIANQLLTNNSLELRLIPAELDRFVKLVLAKGEDSLEQLLAWLQENALLSTLSEVPARVSYDN